MSPENVCLYVCGKVIGFLNKSVINASSILFCHPRFVYETEHHNGIAELLEILGRYVKKIRFFCQKNAI